MNYFLLDYYNEMLYIINIMKIHPLKKWLKKNNISTKEFAGLIGVSISYVNYITSFKRTPSLRLLKKILEATNNQLTINDFININGKEEL